MIKLFKKILLIGVTIFAVTYAYYKWAHKIISYSQGPTTKQQIYQSIENASRKNYQLVFLGNSRIYRGLNPDIFNIPAYNFSHDNDAYNQVYYKLDYLKKLGKNIKYVVLGVDYYSFSFLSDTRNYVYGNIFPPTYLKDFDTVHTFFDSKNRLNDKANEFLTQNYNNTIFVFMANLKNRILGKKNTNQVFLKENGQFIKPGIASERDKSFSQCKILDLQKLYFKKLIGFCKQYGIKIFLIMPPSRETELSKFTKEQKDEFNQWLDSFADEVDVFYTNYSTDNRFQTSDFTDITHLNEAGADRFSSIVNEDMKRVFK